MSEVDRSSEYSFSVNLKYMTCVILAVVILTGFTHWTVDLYVGFITFLFMIGCVAALISTYMIRRDGLAYAKSRNMTVEQVNGPLGDSLFRAPPVLSILKLMIIPLLAGLAGFNTQAIIIASCCLLVFGFKSTYKVLQ